MHGPESIVLTPEQFANMEPGWPGSLPSVLAYREAGLNSSQCSRQPYQRRKLLQATCLMPPESGPTSVVAREEGNIAAAHNYDYASRDLSTPLDFVRINGQQRPIGTLTVRVEP